LGQLTCPISFLIFLVSFVLLERSPRLTLRSLSYQFGMTSVEVHHQPLLSKVLRKHRMGGMNFKYVFTKWQTSRDQPPPGQIEPAELERGWA
jgi:hypothetical protein